MPRKTCKDKIIEQVYMKGIFDLLDLETSDESEAEEVEVNTLTKLQIVCYFKGFLFGN